MRQEPRRHEVLSDCDCLSSQVAYGDSELVSGDLILSGKRHRFVGSLYCR